MLAAPAHQAAEDAEADEGQEDLQAPQLAQLSQKVLRLIAIAYAEKLRPGLHPSNRDIVLNHTP